MVPLIVLVLLNLLITGSRVFDDVLTQIAWSFVTEITWSTSDQSRKKTKLSISLCCQSCEHLSQGSSAVLKGLGCDNNRIYEQLGLWGCTHHVHMHETRLIFSPSAK